MAETKPTKVGQWATNANRTLEPALGEKQVGWEVQKKPPARFMNWLHNVAYLWHNWLDERMFDGGSAKDFAVRGVDIIAGTDVDGGDLEIGGGSSTGDGGSEVNFKVAKAGQGAGAGVRTPVNVGAFTDNGAFNLPPSASDPATPSAGDISMRSPARIRVYNGTSLDRYAAQAYSSDAVSTPIANTAVETIFDTNYTIPADALLPGSVIRVRFMGGVNSIDAAPGLNISLRLGGLAGELIRGFNNAVIAATDIFAADQVIAIRTIGAVGTAVAYGWLINDAQATAAPIMKKLEFNLDTTIAQQIVITANWTAAHANNSCQLEHLLVNIT